MLRAWSNEPLGDAPGSVVLDADESHHLVRVRRVSPGETVEILDGRGTVATATVADPDPRRAALAVSAVRRVTRPTPRVVLAVCPIKAGGLDAVLASAAELGVDRVVPLVTERTEVRIARDRLPTWRAKVGALLREAAKQCGLPWLPEVDDPTSWAAFLAASSPDSCRMVAALDERRRSPEQVLAETPGAGLERVVAVGPEGDFTPAELAAAREAGFQPVTLGPYVLRVPTAAIAAVARLAAGR